MVINFLPDFRKDSMQHDRLQPRNPWEFVKHFSEKSDCRDVVKAKVVDLVTIFVLFDIELIF